MEESKKLTEAKNYDTIKIDFVKFLADPTRTETQEQFAKRFKVNAVTLSKWKQEPGFKEMYVQLLEQYLQDNVSDVYKVMHEKAKSGDFNWGKLYLQQANILKQEKQPNINVDKGVFIVNWGKDESDKG